MEPACEVSRRGGLAPFSGPRALAAPESAGSPGPEPPNGCTAPLPAKAAYGQDPASCYIPLRRLQDLASMISAEYLSGAASPRPPEPAALAGPQAAGSPQAPAELGRRSLAGATCCEEPAAELGRAGPAGGSAGRGPHEPIAAVLCSPSPPAERQGQAPRDAAGGKRTERVELRPVPGKIPIRVPAPCGAP
ncbi:collagen alpha-1(I) chain-like [Gopherus flavomarginatus]|uniref:collagen alpha-1(I) chain-like n=1 Tax=Gopherus flavomarginatus TaxID=286002 RepID=UPI0021CBB205|nr:collagen alpha-1(I) chain-like [Gopherus flavomarginatus]